MMMKAARTHAATRFFIIAGIAGVNAAVRLSGRESVQRAQRYCDCAGCGDFADFADFAGLAGLAGGAGAVCGAAAAGAGGGTSEGLWKQVPGEPEADILHCSIDVKKHWMTLPSAPYDSIQTG